MTRRMPESSDEGSVPRVDGLYRALVAMRVHHDRMLWSRVQILIAVQAAIIAGSYAAGNHEFAAMFLLAGAMIAFVLFVLVTKDQSDRDANSDLMDALGALLLPTSITRQLELQGRTRPYIRFAVDPPKWRPFARGRYLIRIVIWAFILLDIALAVLHVLGKAPIAIPPR